MIWTLFTVMSALAQSPLAMAKPAGMKTWGYIDTSGKFVIEATYEKCERFSEDGYANIYVDKKYGFIDPTGKKLETEVDGYALKSVFGFGTYGFDEGMTAIEVKKKWGFMSSDGKVAIQPKYDWVSHFQDGLATARLGKSDYFILDKSGKETKVQAANLMEIRRPGNGMIPIKTLEKQFGFVDTTGKTVIEPTFKAVGYFVDGLAWAKTWEGKVGYIDRSGNWKIEAKYDAAHEFSEGLGRVKLETTWLYVKPDGTEVKVDAETPKDFHEGLAEAKRDTLWGFIDKSGKWKIEPKFENTREFKNGLAAAKSGGLWGFIDTSGNWKIEPTFQTARDFEKTKP